MSSFSQSTIWLPNFCLINSKVEVHIKQTREPLWFIAVPSGLFVLLSLLAVYKGWLSIVSGCSLVGISGFASTWALRGVTLLKVAMGSPEDTRAVFHCHGLRLFVPNHSQPRSKEQNKMAQKRQFCRLKVYSAYPLEFLFPLLKEPQNLRLFEQHTGVRLTQCRITLSPRFPGHW